MINFGHDQNSVFLIAVNAQNVFYGKLLSVPSSSKIVYCDTYWEETTLSFFNAFFAGGVVLTLISLASSFSVRWFEFFAMSSSLAILINGTKILSLSTQLKFKMGAETGASDHG